MIELWFSNTVEPPSHPPNFLFHKLTEDGILCRGIDEGHCVHVEVQQAVEWQELCWVLVMSGKLSHKVVLQHAHSEAKHHDCNTDRQHNQHQCCGELEPQIWNKTPNNVSVVKRAIVCLLLDLPDIASQIAHQSKALTWVQRMLWLEDRWDTEGTALQLRRKISWSPENTKQDQAVEEIEKNKDKRELPKFENFFQSAIKI